ncbi:transposase [Pseudomonas kilonensis]|nr:transposase [Pseudomonas kilonensis]
MVTGINGFGLTKRDIRLDAFDRPKCRQRNIIERMFGWLKENRRIVIRFDKFAKSYVAMVSLDCSMRCMRHHISYRT